jgi:hypothetical protein
MSERNEKEENVKICCKCHKTLDISLFKDVKGSKTSTCISCLAKKPPKQSSNVVWNNYPELKQIITDWNKHPFLTGSSKQPLVIKCKCSFSITTSLFDLLSFPYCSNCKNCFLKSKSSLRSLVKLTKSFVLDSTDYITFNDKVKKLQIQDKGAVQEIFAKYYFESHKKHFNIKGYYSRLLKDDIPEDCKVHKKDVGTDGVILHNDGKISLVQVKFRSNQKEVLQRDCLSGMSLEALGTEDKLLNLFLFSNTFSIPKNISNNENKKIKYIMYEELQGCEWGLIQE